MHAGMDIASEASQCGAASVHLSCRRRVHVVPRYIFGCPSDAMLPSWLGVTMGRRAQERLVSLLIRLSRGSQASFGFPAPDFGLLRASGPLGSKNADTSAGGDDGLLITTGLACSMHACKYCWWKRRLVL
jgi:hypothetical protein